MRQNDREKEKKGREGGREEEKRKKQRKKEGRGIHFCLRAHNPWGQSISPVEQAQELVRVTFRLAC